MGAARHEFLTLNTYYLHPFYFHIFFFYLQEVKQLFALVCKTLKYASVLEQVMTIARLLEKEKWLKAPVAMCLTYDLLLGKGLRYIILKKHYENMFIECTQNFNLPIDVTLTPLNHTKYFCRKKYTHRIAARAASKAWVGMGGQRIGVQGGWDLILGGITSFWGVSSK